MEPFKISMKVEYSQLNRRVQSLQDFLNKQSIHQTIDFDEIDNLKKQLEAMVTYRDILYTRCVKYKIEI